MSDREISPWPWRLWDETMGVQVLDAEGNLICFTESTANAHAMVAAPEMLAALKAVRECTYIDRTQLVDAPCEDCIRLIDAAIAKAQGEVDG